jgi:hypothetical protein
MEYKLPDEYKSRDKFQYSLEKSEYVLSQIKSIKPMYAGYRSKLYDIEVENTHNFFAGNSLVHNCVRYAEKFNPEKSKNPFSYFTQTSYYAFLRTILREKKNDYVKHKSMLNALATNVEQFEDIDEDFTIDVLEYNQDNIEQFIRDFEKKNFGEELALDETAGNAGKRREIKSTRLSTTKEPTGFF